MTEHRALPASVSPTRRPISSNGTASNGAAPYDDEPTLGPPDVRAVLQTLRRRWLLLLVIPIVAAGITGYVAQRRRPSYQATAVIRMADARRAMAGGLGASPNEVLTGRVVDPVLSLIEVLTSRRVAGTVVDSVPVLRLQSAGFPVAALSDIRFETPNARDSLVLRFGTEGVGIQMGEGATFGPYNAPVRVPGLRFTVPKRPSEEIGVLYIASREWAISQLLAKLTVKPREGTDVADVSYVATDSTLAQEVTNRIVETFRAVNAQGEQQQSRLRREFAEEQLRQNDAELMRAQAALSAFRGAAQVYSSKDRLTADQAAISATNVRRQELETDLRLYQQALSALESERDDLSPVGTLIAMPNVAANPMIPQEYGRLVALRATRDSLTVGPWGRGPSHPEVIRVDTLLRVSEGNLREAVRSLIASVQARIRGLDALGAQKAEAFRTVSGKETQEAQLVEQVEALRTMSNELRSEYQRARIAEAVEVGQVDVVDSATDPHRIGLGPLPLAGFVGGLAFLLAAALVLLLEHLNTSIRRQGQVQTSLHLPELAVIPELNGRLLRRLRSQVLPAAAVGTDTGPPHLGESVVAALAAQSPDAEAYRILRTNLLFSSMECSPRSILITSPAPGDGKTTVAANLGVAFAHQGMRVLLIDCDLRRGRLHKVFSVAREPGLAQLLRGRVGLGDVVRRTVVEGLSVVPAGLAPKAHTELLGGESMRRLLDQGLAEYDVVLLDSPPVLATADPSVLSAMVEATVVVLRAGATGEEEAHRTVAQLRAVGARIAGAVINDLDSTIRRYGGRYAKYYSYTSPPA